MNKFCLLLFVFPLLCLNCKTRSIERTDAGGKINVIFDTDANNELDDQHALAYLLFNKNTFNVEGVTVNATYNGGDISKHFEEAERIIKLCGAEGRFPLLKGANNHFLAIKETLDGPAFDGKDAVHFILQRAGSRRVQPLVFIAIGKLTNIALAIKKDPSIINKIRVVWLGSNYPERGEYNQDNDTAALNFLLNTSVPFEMVTVRYGKPSGTDAVKVTQQEIITNMQGKGPKIASPVTGRHGGAFTRFGDYSVNLFEHIEYFGTPPSRALFDMAAVAILKNPSWARRKEVPAPLLVNNQWMERLQNQRKITIWENFDRDKIIADFFQTIDESYLEGKTKN